MRKLAILSALCVILFLAGCVELTEDVWINPDATGRFKMDIGIFTDDVWVSSGETREDALKEIRKDQIKKMKAKKKKLEKMAFVEEVRISKHYGDKRDHFIYDAQINDIYNLGKVYGEICRGQIDEDTVWRIDVERLKNGNILFRQIFSSKEIEKGKAKKKKEAAETEGRPRYYIVRLHAPKIIVSNGRLAEDRKTVIWKMRMDDLEEMSARTELTAEIQGPLPLRVLIAVILIAGLLIAWVMYSIVKRRMRKHAQG